MSAAVTRRDDGAALRTLRVGVHPEALVLHVGTDVVVRTPARPDHRDGNVVDLLEPPDPTAIATRIEGVRRLMEPIGVAHVHLRYELAPGAADDDARAVALRDAGLTVTDLRVLAADPGVLPDRAPAPPASVTVERLAGPTGDVIDERRWYAAAVLDRYAHGDDVDTWRGWDEEWGAWDRGRVTALARLGRAEVWLASRHGMPVATLTLLDDHDGLVVIEDAVTHPAHRRRGIARALLGAALASLRTSRAVERVALAVTPGAPVETLYRGAGLEPLGEVRSWLRPAPASAAPAAGGPPEPRR